MAATLDVYKEWLGITEPARPLNFYQLLRLSSFEDDVAKVRSNYRKMNAHVRKYAAGDFAKQSQDLLNELARAMLCLTDRQRKAEYDASLGRKTAGDDRRRSLEELFILRKVLTPEQLQQAKRYANDVGLELRDAVVQRKFTQADIAMQIYAESEGLPYVDLADVGVDEALVPKLPAIIARKCSCAPLLLDDKVVLLASPNPISPDVEDELRLRFGFPVRTVLCTASAINSVVEKYYPKAAAQAELAAASNAPPKVVATKASGQTADGELTDDDGDEAGAEDTPQAAAARNQISYIAALIGYIVGMCGVWMLPARTLRRIPLSSLLPYALGAIVALIAFVVARSILRRRT